LGKCTDMYNFVHTQTLTAIEYVRYVHFLYNYIKLIYIYNKKRKKEYLRKKRTYRTYPLWVRVSSVFLNVHIVHIVQLKNPCQE
jgi:hypothetical protein